MNTTPIHALLLAALALPLAAQAQSAAGRQGPAGHQTVLTAPLAAAPAPQAERDLASVVYSNFGGPENLFDSTTGWTIAGRQSIPALYQATAMAFSPALPVRITKARLAVGYVSGTNALKVSLHEDDGGRPGAVLKQLTLQALPAFGQCCATASAGFGGVPVQAGHTYWLVARTAKKSDTWAAWNLNSTSTLGAMALDSGSGWSSFTDQNGAFEVLGR